MSVALAKGQSVSLTETAGSAPAQITLGVGWDMAKKGFFSGLLGGKGIDLDASCLAFDADKRVIEAVWFGGLANSDKTICHGGDNANGTGDGDDETITVDLAKLSGEVETLVLVLNSFRGQTFDEVESTFGRVFDASSGHEFARVEVAGHGEHTGVILAKLSRDGGAWTFTAIGEDVDGRSVNDLVVPAQSVI